MAISLQITKLTEHPQPQSSLRGICFLNLGQQSRRDPHHFCSSWMWKVRLMSCWAWMKFSISDSKLIAASRAMRAAVRRACVPRTKALLEAIALAVKSSTRPAMATRTSFVSATTGTTDRVCFFSLALSFSPPSELDSSLSVELSLSLLLLGLRVFRGSLSAAAAEAAGAAAEAAGAWGTSRRRRRRSLSWEGFLFLSRRRLRSRSLSWLRPLLATVASSPPRLSPAEVAPRCSL